MTSDSRESEGLARDFHDTYERLSAEHGWKSQESCQVEFDALPEANRKLMLAVCAEIYERYVAQQRQEIEALRRERDEARAWNQQMVEKAASGGVLDGYRELGQKCAALEARCDEVSKVLATAQRIGADTDDPEGARYIQISDTLAKRLCAVLQGEQDDG